MVGAVHGGISEKMSKKEDVFSSRDAKLNLHA